jgi:hypothetical protein
MAFDSLTYTITELVERATSEMLIQPDWEKNFLVVEEIRSQPSCAPGWVFFFAIRKVV